MSTFWDSLPTNRLSFRATWDSSSAAELLKRGWPPPPFSLWQTCQQTTAGDHISVPHVASPKGQPSGYPLTNNLKGTVQPKCKFCLGLPNRMSFHAVLRVSHFVWNTKVERGSKSLFTLVWTKCLGVFQKIQKMPLFKWQQKTENFHLLRELTRRDWKNFPHSSLLGISSCGNTSSMKSKSFSKSQTVMSGQYYFHFLKSEVSSQPHKAYSVTADNGFFIGTLLKERDNAL